MRNPERIDKVLDKLRAIWKQHPDLRFGQLVYNVLDIRATAGRFVDYMLNIESDQLHTRLDDFIEFHGIPFEGNNETDDLPWEGEPADPVEDIKKLVESMPKNAKAMGKQQDEIETILSACLLLMNRLGPKNTATKMTVWGIGHAALHGRYSPTTLTLCKAINKAVSRSKK